MSELSRFSTDETFEWVAHCPKCRGKADRSNVQCPNCDSHAFKFVREWHTAESDRRRTWWSECRFECGACGLKTKSVLCPHDHGTILGIPLITAYLPIRRLNAKAGELQGVIALGLAVALAYIVYPMASSLINDAYGLDIPSYLIRFFSFNGSVTESSAEFITGIFIFILSCAAGWVAVLPTIYRRMKYGWRSYER